jgi:hypothetical protein
LEKKCEEKICGGLLNPKQIYELMVGFDRVHIYLAGNMKPFGGKREMAGNMKNRHSIGG